jgi:hypothetical protein
MRKPQWGKIFFFPGRREKREMLAGKDFFSIEWGE